MAVTLSDLRTRVNDKLRNYEFIVVFRTVGDGTTVTFMLPIGDVKTGTVSATVDGVTATVSSSDLTAPSTTLSAAPAADSVVLITYTCRLWSDADVNAAINESVRYFWPLFPLEDVDTSLTAGINVKYELPTSVGYVFRVEVWSTAYDYEKIKGWRTHIAGGKHYLIMPQAPGSGTIHVYHKPAVVGFTSDSDQMESTAKIDESAADPIVYYAVAACLRDNVALRVRDNAFLNATGSNAPKFWDVMRASDTFLSDAKRIADSVRSTPRIGRF